jgi:PTS system ascorbate-specific IIA component
MLRKENVIINYDVNSPVSALQHIGDVLYQCGSVTQQYIENMIQSYHELGPYFVIAPGIAIAHAKPDESVLHNDLALMVCPKSVTFNSHNDPVYLVFGLCANSAHGHMDGLMTLSELLSDEDVVKKIQKADDVDTILELIAPYQKGEPL